MQSITMMPSTEEAKSGFYPTPQNVAEKLLEDVDWFKVGTILEPSAGKGDLCFWAAKAWNHAANEDRYASGNKIEIDCVEIDPDLKAILTARFLEARADALWDRYREENDVEAGNVARVLENTRLHVVGDDFLSFSTYKKYDLIVMNPPFANGDEHLLKAIRLQKVYGGEIRCILNAETIRNPYTNQRKILARMLDELDAKVDYMEGGFLDAERETDVEIALVSISIPEPEKKSEFFDRLKGAEQVEDTPVQSTDMTVTDFVKAIVARFKVECEAGIALIREYNAMRPYIMEDMKVESYTKPTLSLLIQGRSGTAKINDYLELVRLKYWTALFTNPEFMSQLTSTLRQEYLEQVGKLKYYDFSEYNIRQIVLDMNSKMNQGVTDTIVKLFDEMTEKHCWYPECAQNIHYYNGWRTNLAHKVNKKVILPCNGIFSTYSWTKDTFSVRNAFNCLTDIEKVFNYLDGHMSAEVDLNSCLQVANQNGKTKNICCKFFTVTFYKKGTMHIVFHDQALVDRFNIFCCRQKNWLPPCYGRKVYADLTDEEKTVVDGFHEDKDAKTSVEDRYNAIVNNSQFYLSEPGGQMPALI